MKRSYTQLYIHIIFAVKHRRKLIKPEFENRLWGYIAGIANNIGAHAIQAGGCEDHLHLLLSNPPTMTTSELIQKIKGNSSKWINDTFYPDRRFRWQEGYGAFSVGHSQLNRVVRYIKNQKIHHQGMSFDEEFKWFLNRHGLKFDENYFQHI